MICAVLTIVRTALEDRTLRAELEGYASYALRVRARLIPAVAVKKGLHQPAQSL